MNDVSGRKEKIWFVFIQTWYSNSSNRLAPTWGVKCDYIHGDVIWVQDGEEEKTHL